MRVDRQPIVVRVLLLLVLLVMSVSFLYPFFFMLANSFKTRTDYGISPFNLPPPGHWQLNNYVAMVSQFRIFTLFRNSAIVIVGSGLSILGLAICASYAFAKLDFRGRQLVYVAVVATMFIPGQVTMIPMYVMFARLGLINTFLSVILAYLAGHLPGNILLMTANFRGIPNSLFEAAKIDGCSYFQTVRTIVVPMGRSAIAINVIFNAIYMWNDLFTPMILLQKMEVRTVMVALATLMQRYYGDPTYQMAGLFLSTIPAVLIYLVFQRQIVKGITVGAVK
jgi:raffinose/stachyose/melibiose transport system permease protein